MKKSFIFVLLTSFLVTLALAEPHHQLVKVYVKTEAQIERLLELEMDISRVQRGEYVEVVTTENELNTLKSYHYNYEVIIDDMEDYFVKQNPNAEPMGGFFTYSEMVDRLNLIHAQYPDLTTAPYSIGISWENRDLWVIKVSDNPNVDENEPEVWYDGLHHAREPIGMQLLMYFIEYLLQNYGIIPDVTTAVNERELFFCPCTNPDGYVYNQTTNPSGGGMWRKNRRNNGGGIYGVDLNRNYPFDWGHDNIGSSGSPSSETYRGPYPASEPEIQAITNYINSRQIALSHSYHSYGDYCMFPWCANYNGYTPDNTTFYAIGNQISTWNGYEVGTVWEVLYNVNGGSIDWHYGQQDVHWKIMAFTQEVGPSFWPPQSQIEALCQENLMPNLYSALIAEDFVPPPNYFTFVEKEVVDSTGNNNGVADPGEAVDLNVTIRNSGSATATGINSTLFTSDPLITITSANSAYPDLAVLATGENLTPFHFQVANNYPIGDTAMLKLRFTAAGGYDDTLTITLPIGDPLSQPSGPDAYGYLAYDQLDGHEMGDFEWVEIDPAYGGSGTSIPFTADDQTVQRPIPFTFTYYGQDYTQVSICTNGWVAMGYTTDTDHSNSQIPNPDGPPSMVAPFWEDLSPQASGAVLTYYDAVNQLFIVEFSRVRQYTPTTAFETFEAIFYNPAEYPTVTGDGLIKFQYLIVSDPTSCTVGIENQTETIGLQLLYNTSYNVNMRPIEDSSAAIFTTGEEIPGVTIALTPSSLPIIIPPQGGSFTYNLAIQNISTTQVFFDAWLEAMLPDSSIYEIMVRSNLSLGPGASISRNMTQNVPAVAPAGDYTYFGIVGNYPNAVYSQSSFPFSKSGADNSGMGNWNISGWEESGISAMMPTEYALGQNYPNPFNPETTIEFALPEASKVKLSVYNIKGELVEVLMEGNLETGYHTVNWNASAMPSGIYFYKLQADDFMSVKKCVLVK